jgi:hypothetical protein
MLQAVVAATKLTTFWRINSLKANARSMHFERIAIALYRAGEMSERTRWQERDDLAVWRATPCISLRSTKVYRRIESH